MVGRRSASANLWKRDADAVHDPVWDAFRPWGIRPGDEMLERRQFDEPVGDRLGAR